VLEVLLSAQPENRAEEPRASASSARPEPPALDEIVRSFPEFDGFELLGRGGMGVVYKARQKKLERQVALKILPREFGLDPKYRERFLREARALARLVHPNIVAVHDYGENDGLCFLVLELVDGTNLRDVLRRGPLAPHEALAIVRALCDALQYAHDEGIVHRDIKPENVLLDRAGRVKVADFGLAKVTGVEGGVHLTAVDQVMGTPHYMAPEQMERPLDVDHRADLFALGVVMYEMLTGTLPRGAFALPSHTLHVDVRLDEVVLKALERDPTRRYQQAIEVKTDVDQIESSALRSNADAASQSTSNQASHSDTARVAEARTSRRNSLRGVRGVALCAAAWIVVAVAWNLGPFALGLSVPAFFGLAVVLLRAEVASRPRLAADVAEHGTRGSAARVAGSIVLGLAAVTALFVGHVAAWERGTQAWAPSDRDADDLHGRILPEPTEPRPSPASGETFTSTTTTRVKASGLDSSSTTPFSIPPWALVVLGLLTITAAAYVAIRPHAPELRAAAWQIAGRTAGQISAGLACTWIACSLAVLNSDDRVHDIQLDHTYESSPTDVVQQIRSHLRSADLRIDLDEEIEVADERGRHLFDAHAFRAAASSPLDRWKLSLTGPRRDTPQLWVVVTPAADGRSTSIRVRGGKYVIGTPPAAAAANEMTRMHLELR